MSSACLRSDEYKKLWERLKQADVAGDLYLNVEIEGKAEQDALLLALRKQSLKDKGFRFVCIQKDKSFTIGFNRVGGTLQLYLKWRPHVTDAFAGIKKQKGN